MFNLRPLGVNQINSKIRGLLPLHRCKSVSLGKMASERIHIIYPLCESDTQDEEKEWTDGSFSHAFKSQTPALDQMVSRPECCLFADHKNGMLCVFHYLLDPFWVFQGFEEGVLRVRRGGAWSTGPQQFFKSSFHLPCVCKVHWHQLTVQRGVHSEALQTEECKFQLREKYNSVRKVQKTDTARH